MTDCDHVSHSLSHIPDHAMPNVNAADRVRELSIPVYWNGVKHDFWTYDYAKDTNRAAAPVRVQMERALETFNTGAPPTLADSPNYYGPYNFHVSQREMPYKARGHSEFFTPQH